MSISIENLEALVTRHVIHNPHNLVVRDYLENLNPTIVECLLRSSTGEQGDANWDAWRLRHLNTSEFGSVLGCDKHKTRDYLFREKTGQLTANEILAAESESNLYPLQFGHLFEPEGGYIYSMRKRDIGLGLGSVECTQKGYEFMASSLDLIMLRSNNIAEIKTPARRTLKVLPFGWTQMKMYLPSYCHQTQGQMFVTGINRNQLMQYFCSDNDNHRNGTEMLTISDVTFDSTWIENVGQDLKNFWDDVLRYRAANPDWELNIRPRKQPRPDFSYTEMVDKVNSMCDTMGNFLPLHKRKTIHVAVTNKLKKLAPVARSLSYHAELNETDVQLEVCSM